ncbi:conserved hypothetical protein [Paecilomyces variotii No. 5]|uniref:Wax synthase domain-containing protein n=1 Tax=Byssochlamys spectabilis (strain No. 5 / NBRC 109023) TaxID=1356009 RepID=V5FJM8_BYSSN|nr:conserved hypothetical protein [Paecilomyces variotii No. 5]
MKTTNANTYRELIAQRGQYLEYALQSGEYDPFLVHHFFLLLALPIVALFIPGRSLILRFSRYIFFISILGLGSYIIGHTRAFIVGNGYCIGLVTTWWVVWSGVMLIVNDVQKDFKRLETFSVPASDTINDESQPSTSESPNANSKVKDNGSPVRHRRTSATQGTDTALPATAKEYKEVIGWQPYPEPVGHRLNWIIGLLFNFRGTEWNWRISAVPPFPKSIPDPTDRKSSTVDTSEVIDLRKSRKCLKKAILIFLRAYISLDVIKVIMMRDRYFWGFVSDPAPPLLPFGMLAAYPLLLRIYRLFFSGIGILVALDYVTSLNPIIFLGLSLAFPNASRAVTRVPLEAEWLYPDVFGHLGSSILNHGIAGCWGMWWHQLFRFSFSEPARWLASFLPQKLQNCGGRRIIYLLIPFGISGLLHALGSYCQMAVTDPWSGPFPFFFLQSVGVGVQRFLAKQVLPKILPFHPPRWLRRATNLAVVIAWFYLTGPVVADDFAAGGVWLVEPVPISILRGLGLGAEGEGWWCLRGDWFEWWNGETWWQSGIRFV